MHRVSESLVFCSELYETGLVIPFSPHLTVLWDIVVPADYEQWMEYDLDVLSHMNAVIRRPGESPGADREVTRAREMPIPVFHKKDDLLVWAETWDE